MTELKTPEYIQRCSIKDIKGGSIDAFLSYDSMGRAEFEFGALNKSLKRLLPLVDEFVIKMHGDIIHRDGRRLCVVAPSATVDLYRKYVSAFSTGDGHQTRFNIGEEKVLLCEPTHLAKTLKSTVVDKYPTETDTWWDLDNDLFFLFGKANAKALVNVLKKTKIKLNL